MVSCTDITLLCPEQFVYTSLCTPNVYSGVLKSIYLFIYLRNCLVKSHCV